jgi:hypothetical protein
LFSKITARGKNYRKGEKLPRGKKYRKAYGTSPKGALWAENCPNFLAGKLKFSLGKDV